MKKYTVRYKIDARYEVEVEANSIEEAIKKADPEFNDADFGEAINIDGEAIIVYDDENDGDIVWEQ